MPTLIPSPSRWSSVIRSLESGQLTVEALARSPVVVGGEAVLRMASGRPLRNGWRGRLVVGAGDLVALDRLLVVAAVVNVHSRSGLQL